MNKEDARKLPASAQEEKCKLAIKLWKKNKRIKDIAEIADVTPKAVGGWIKRYQAEGASALRSQKRGRQMGQNRHLTRER